MIGSSFPIKLQPLTQGLFKVPKFLIIAPYAIHFSFTNTSKFTNTSVNVIISRPVVIYELWLYLTFTNNPTPIRSQSSFSKPCMWNKSSHFYRNQPIWHHSFSTYAIFPPNAWVRNIIFSEIFCTKSSKLHILLLVLTHLSKTLNSCTVLNKETSKYSIRYVSLNQNTCGDRSSTP